MLDGKRLCAEYAFHIYKTLFLSVSKQFQEFSSSQNVHPWKCSLIKQMGSSEKEKGVGYTVHRAIPTEKSTPGVNYFYEKILSTWRKPLHWFRLGREKPKSRQVDWEVGGICGQMYSVLTEMGKSTFMFMNDRHFPR